MGFWNRDRAPASWGGRQPLRRLDWAFLAVVYVVAWAMVYASYRIVGETEATSIWYGLVLAGIAPLGCGWTWVYPNVSNAIRPRSHFLFAGATAVAGGIALGFELHASGRNFYQTLLEGKTLHARWRLQEGFGWSFRFWIVAFVVAMTGVRSWFWRDLLGRRARRLGVTESPTPRSRSSEPGAQ